VPSTPVPAGSKSTQSLFESLDQNFAPKDITVFQNKFNLKKSKVAKVIGDNDPNSCYRDPDTCGEANLDVQYIMGIAQNSPTSYFSVPYNSSDPFDDIFFRYLEILADEVNPPLVHSLSYTIEESVYAHIQMFEMELKKLSLKGLTFLVSSGDYGAVSPIVNIGGTSKCGYYVEYPASSPLMTSIGATQGPELSQEEIDGNFYDIKSVKDKFDTSNLYFNNITVDNCLKVTYEDIFYEGIGQKMIEDYLELKFKSKLQNLENKMRLDNNTLNLQYQKFKKLI
jgi:subtilase family serine protease